MLDLRSPDITNGDVIPKRFSCEGDDMSPELIWEGEPAGTKSYSLIVEDPDAPGGMFTHWVVYDMPAQFHHLYRGMGNDIDLKDGFKQGSTDFGYSGYGGPCPPKGHGRHRYNFIIRALDIPSLGLPDGATKSEVEMAMQGHVLAEAKITGIYQRQ
ncbi:MAG: YbhB/YbcL family Raf kinase inhibitor-like protein [Deltaproteobacteria bacterium]|nr:YbhB/YbcL family Raf kinase inhibitor-like protein [Deltaproteobacteria bacterium]